jgi:hypothetical protein
VAWAGVCCCDREPPDRSTKPLAPRSTLIHTYTPPYNTPPRRGTQMRDLGSNFFLTEQDVGKPRASACAAKLAELNSMVTVR